MKKKSSVTLHKGSTGYCLVVEGEKSPEFSYKILGLNKLTDLAQNKNLNKKDVFTTYKKIVELSEDELPLFHADMPQSEIDEDRETSEQTMQLGVKAFEALAQLEDCPPESFLSYNCGACELLHAYVIDKNGTEHRCSTKEEAIAIVDHLLKRQLFSIENALKVTKLINAEDRLPSSDEEFVVIELITIDNSFFN